MESTVSTSQHKENEFCGLEHSQKEMPYIPIWLRKLFKIYLLQELQINEYFEYFS